jgi:hypothetical protein
MVHGLVPDRITEVTLLTAGGGSETARVSDNAYGVDLRATLAGVVIDGKTVLRLGGPAG